MKLYEIAVVMWTTDVFSQILDKTHNRCSGEKMYLIEIVTFAILQNVCKIHKHPTARS